MNAATLDTQGLPPGFDALEPFVAQWAIPTLEARVAARGDATADERASFYAIAAELLEPALAYLDGRPCKLPDERDRRLMHLMLSLAHVALAEEVQRDEESMHTELRSFMPISRSFP